MLPTIYLFLLTIYLFLILLCSFLFGFAIYNYSKSTKGQFRTGIIFPVVMLGIANFVFLFLYIFTTAPRVTLICIFNGFSVWIIMIWLLLGIIKIEK
nr:MAG TPA: hypothetical protein [Caudoviricetes sp.]